MKNDNTFEPRAPRTFVVLDIESAVTDETGHKRYQAMERWVPKTADQPSRRGYTRSEDPCRTPRWPFQTIVTAAIMVLAEDEAGGISVTRFTTLSQPEHDERAIVQGLLQVLGEMPRAAEIVSWAGMIHDLPLISLAAMRHGLTLPQGWSWLAFGGNAPRHLDFARIVTGGFRMKPVHQAEVLASLDIPAKISVPAFAVARLIYAGQWDAVQEAAECDVISTALLLARWRQLHDCRADIDVVEDRVLRQVIELRRGRGYVNALQARRQARFRHAARRAANDASALAPWLDLDAA